MDRNIEQFRRNFIDIIEVIPILTKIDKNELTNHEASNHSGSRVIYIYVHTCVLIRYSIHEGWSTRDKHDK